MKKLSFMAWPVACCALFLGVLLWSGCGRGPAPEAGVEAPPVDDEPELSPEDQALVDAQKICPVSEGPLGGMGVPDKVMVGDRPVFICCPPCREPLLSEPEKYLALLDEVASRQTPDGQPSSDGDDGEN